MIHLIETKNYRSLKYIHRELDNFQILIGPNASGKTTFLDTIGFIADIVSDGIDSAITKRSANFSDLTFSGSGGYIELAIEAKLPENISKKLHDTEFDTIRYELKIGLSKLGEHEINEEKVLLLKYDKKFAKQKITENRVLFPEIQEHEASILGQKYSPNSYKNIIKKIYGGNDNFYTETSKSSGWIPSFRLGPKKSALGNLPADETRFPASTWFKEYLTEGIQLFVLNSQKIRLASPPGKSKKFQTDGSNLPWIIDDLKKNHLRKFEKWIKHLKTALPDIEDIDTVEREDDKHRYLKIHYRNDIVVPSWLVSDGTLRLLALTLPAYLPDFTGVYLIEEPENGIHPKAIETVYQSLSSVYNAQILLATHSPVILSLIDYTNYKNVLCFAKTQEGITDIVRGDEHPALKTWRGEVNFSVLYAGGILG